MAENNNGGDWNGKFSMPMFKQWVPEKLRPWLYVYLAFTFQLSGGVYIGALNEMVGATSLMHEDLMMCFYAGLCGLAFTFPILFRTKFRFTNRTLLLTSTLGIAAINIIGLFVNSLPLLWLICFVSGCLKLQGTFECLSNIQLWMTPRRDFRVFFSLLHLWIMLAISVSDLLAVRFCHIATFHYVAWLMIGVMLFNTLWLFICTRHFRFMKPLPFYSIDWLGALLWVLAVMQTVYVCCYGEFYNWWESHVVRTLTLTATLTFVLAIIRMHLIRHPYIEPRMWRNRRLPAILVLAVIIEALFATEHVLEEVFYESCMGWHSQTVSLLNYPAMAGVICAILFALFGLKVKQFGRLRLIALGLAAFAAYALSFYFLVSASTDLHHLWFPIFLRGFAVTLIGITILYTLQSVVNFMVFFQSLAIFQTLHLLVGSVVGAACYSFGMRYLIADSMARYCDRLDNLSLSSADLHCRIGLLMQNFQMVSVKQLYGIAAYVAITLALLLLLCDSLIVRNRRQ